MLFVSGLGISLIRGLKPVKLLTLDQLLSSSKPKSGVSQ